MSTQFQNSNNKLTEFQSLGNVFDKQMAAVYRNTPMNKHYIQERNNYTNNIRRQNTNISNWSSSYNVCS
jgi:hypothetical protein